MGKKSGIIEEFYTVTIARDWKGIVVGEMWKIDQEVIPGRPRKVLHREGLPAWTIRDPDTGIVTRELWFESGVAHRDDGPAEIYRDPKTGVTTQEVWIQNGKVYRHDGPAVIYRSPETGKVTKTHWVPHRDSMRPQEPS
jgi:hypothetical protein